MKEENAIISKINNNKFSSLSVMPKKIQAKLSSIKSV